MARYMKAELNGCIANSAFLLQDDCEYGPLDGRIRMLDGERARRRAAA